jgi:hypothetical protein
MMMKAQAKLMVVTTCVALILGSGCATVDYVADAKARVDAADWSKMQTVPVVLKEYSYTP